MPHTRALLCGLQTAPAATLLSGSKLCVWTQKTGSTGMASWGRNEGFGVGGATGVAGGREGGGMGDGKRDAGGGAGTCTPGH